MSDSVTDKAMDALRDTHKDLMSARAELSRLRGLLEREKLSNVIHSAMYEWMHADVECGESTFVADKLREYLGGGK